jgi:hypothetical protein
LAELRFLIRDRDTKITAASMLYSAPRVCGSSSARRRRHRPHQSRAQRPPDLHADPPFLANLADRRIRRKPILTGLINEHEHAA